MVKVFQENVILTTHVTRRYCNMQVIEVKNQYGFSVGKLIFVMILAVQGR